jgi:predicted site-specific integrase-resolvase
MGAIRSELVTGAEFAKRAGVKQTTVNTWRMRGVIKPEIQITGKVKFYAWPPKVTKRKGA